MVAKPLYNYDAAPDMRIEIEQLHKGVGQILKGFQARLTKLQIGPAQTPEGFYTRTQAEERCSQSKRN